MEEGTLQLSRLKKLEAAFGASTLSSLMVQRKLPTWYDEWWKSAMESSEDIKSMARNLVQASCPSLEISFTAMQELGRTREMPTFLLPPCGRNAANKLTTLLPLFERFCFRQTYRWRSVQDHILFAHSQVTLSSLSTLGVVMDASRRAVPYTPTFATRADTRSAQAHLLIVSHQFERHTAFPYHIINLVEILTRS